MAAGMRQVVIRFSGETKALQKSMGKVSKQVEGWRGKMAKFNRAATIGAAAAGAGLVAVGKDAFNLSNELRDLDAKNKAVFEDQLGPMRKWAAKNKAAFGTSRDQVVGLAANMADLLKPMGFTAEQAAGMSREMLGLSGALASWSGGTHDAAQVSDILTKAMLGEREQLKSLGISISEADVQARIAAKGQQDLTGEALAQAEALATQELIMEKSTDAQKAWEDGGKKAAEAQGRLKSTGQELRETLARALTPAFESVTRMVAKFAGWADKNRGTVKVLAAVLGTLTVALFGLVVAAKAITAAQILWNAAMALNPIGLVVIAIAAFVAALVIAYKKSETFRKIVDKAFKAVAAVIRWWWENIVQRYFRFVGGAITKVREMFTDLPRKIKSAFGGLFRILTTPWRLAFNFIARAWNNTVGQLKWDVPKWVPIIGGNSVGAPKLPTFHRGGIVPGPLGSEVPILARAGERVVPRGQDRPMVLEGVLTLDSGEFMGKIRGVVRERDQALKRRALAGAGSHL